MNTTTPSSSFHLVDVTGHATGSCLAYDVHRFFFPDSTVFTFAFRGPLYQLLTGFKPPAGLIQRALFTLLRMPVLPLMTFILPALTFPAVPVVIPFFCWWLLCSRTITSSSPTLPVRSAAGYCISESLYACCYLPYSAPDTAVLPLPVVVVLHLPQPYSTSRCYLPPQVPATAFITFWRTLFICVSTPSTL